MNKFKSIVLLITATPYFSPAFAQIDPASMAALTKSLENKNVFNTHPTQQFDRLDPFKQSAKPKNAEKADAFEAANHKPKTPEKVDFFELSKQYQQQPNLNANIDHDYQNTVNMSDYERQQYYLTHNKNNAYRAEMIKQNFDALIQQRERGAISQKEYKQQYIKLLQEHERNYNVYPQSSKTTFFEFER
ncbi:hypothetical protein [Acinetobacter larvae]|uniref:Uncharacterized protein n=1 Tax=Acinetobacter larvae TaxID=1789224 RepID=A0A1B2LVV5_9GAMM|nr:hypothetical protein [Acinetobacter larvae]AOA57049.1 hypothetical protein BFG52_00885 [Acinetobacter larvae]